MPTLTRLLTFAVLAVVVCGECSVCNAYVPILNPCLSVGGPSAKIVPPASRGVPNSVGNTLDLEGTQTDADTIISTAQIVEQKAGPQADSLPDQPIPETVVTAVDGELTEAGTDSSSLRVGTRSLQSRSSLLPYEKKRAASDYNLVFSGTGTRTTDRDASIQGTAYLTFRVVPNSTYNVDACLDFCSSEPKCGECIRMA